MIDFQMGASQRESKVSVVCQAPMKRHAQEIFGASGIEEARPSQDCKWSEQEVPIPADTFRAGLELRVLVKDGHDSDGHESSNA